MRRIALGMMVLLLAGLAGCGKVGQLKTEDGNPAPAVKTYPAE